MKSLLIALSATLLSAFAHAQGVSNQAVKPAGLGKPELASNEDKNIRAYIDLLRTDIRKSKAQIMGEVMQLDADQSAKFWPLYKEFETELTSLGDKVAGVVRNYVDHYLDMTDPVADRIATELLAIELRRNELKKKYYDRFKIALGAVAAARFLQVENQLERLVDLQIAASLPVVSQ
jgi:hypothetical protein